MSESIAYCGCGNLSVDGLNFRCVAGTPTLECAACGAVSSDFEYVPSADHRAELEAAEAKVMRRLMKTLSDPEFVQKTLGGMEPSAALACARGLDLFAHALIAAATNQEGET